MFFELTLFFFNYSKAKNFAGKSLLRTCGEEHSIMACPLCDNKGLEQLIDLPIGWPMPQNDHMMYFDYKDRDIEIIKKQRRFIEKTMGFTSGIPWKICSECKNVVLDVKFTDEHLNEYYSKYYNRIASSSEKRKNTKEKYAQYVDSLIKESSQLLEIGCAEGYAAKYLARRGHRVNVIEPSKFRHELTNHKNINAIDKISGLGKESIDCVYLHHVLEHILDIPEFLRDVHSVLKNEGILFIQVPDISLQLGCYLKSLRRCHYSIKNRVKYNKEIADRYFPNEQNSYYWMDAIGNNHLYAFTPFGLEYILKKSNFKIEETQQTTNDRVITNNFLYAWPIDGENGQTPNGLTIIASK